MAKTTISRHGRIVIAIWTDVEVTLECLLEDKFPTVCTLIPQFPIPIFVQCHSAHIPSWLVGMGSEPQLPIRWVIHQPMTVEDMLQIYQSAANSTLP